MPIVSKINQSFKNNLIITSVIYTNKSFLWHYLNFDLIKKIMQKITFYYSLEQNSSNLSKDFA